MTTVGRETWTNRAIPALDRLTCFFGAQYLEAVNLRLKGSPHRELTALVDDADADILEVCAATGFLSRMVAAEFPEATVSALDLSPGMLGEGRARARGLANLNFVLGDATAMPYPDGSFDVVLAAFGLNVLSPQPRDRCLAEIHRVLRWSGRLLVVDIDEAPYRANPVHSALNVVHRRRASGVSGDRLVRQVESRGFRTSRHLNGQGGLFPYQVIVADRVPGAEDV